MPRKNTATKVAETSDAVCREVRYQMSKYAVKIETLDLRVRKGGDKVVSSLLLINNFYEVNKFIKNDISRIIK